MRIINIFIVMRKVWFQISTRKHSSRMRTAPFVVPSGAYGPRERGYGPTGYGPFPPPPNTQTSVKTLPSLAGSKSNTWSGHALIARFRNWMRKCLMFNLESHGDWEGVKFEYCPYKHKLECLAGMFTNYETNTAHCTLQFSTRYVFITLL